MQASIVAFFFCHLDSPINAQAWSPFPLIPRIEGFSAGQPPMSIVPIDPTNNDDKTGFVRQMVPVGVGATMWQTDARDLGANIAFATARGFLGNDFSNNQAECICSSSVFVSRAAFARSSRYFLKWTL